MKICAIHQPNFFPWPGYFDKIRQADVFVFLDEVAYPKSGSGLGSWCNRNKLNIGGEAKWVGCLVYREKGIQLIKDVVLDDRQRWRAKLLKTLELNYRKAKNYHEVMPFLESLILYETDKLGEFNINAIKKITDYLGFKAEFVFQSLLQVDGAANELLVNISKKVGANIYLCGGGAGGYQDEGYFELNSIKIQYQNFSVPPYDLSGSHLMNLSIMDYLMRR